MVKKDCFVDIKEKIAISANPTKLTLFKEGIFYKCYNEDAMVFYKNIKQYKIICKYNKALKSTVLSLGFPESAWNRSAVTLELSNQLGLEEAIDHETFIEYNLNVEAKSGFAAFKATVLDAQEIIPLNEKEQDSKERVLCKLKNFDLANHTPMQAMEFIKELKELL